MSVTMRGHGTISPPSFLPND